MKTHSLLSLPLVFKLTVAAIFAAGCLSSCPAATVFLWNVASPGANNWNDNANWLPATGNPGSADTAVLGAIGTSAGATTINNVVSVNTTVTSVQYTNVTTGQWHVTQIPANVTLTASGNLIVGGLISEGTAESVALVDAGTLLQTGGNFVVGNSGVSTFQNVTLDMSGLSNFVYSVNAGFFNVGASNRGGGTFTMAAASNSVTAGTMNIGTGSTSSSGTQNLRLGSGTNKFNVTTLNLGAGRETGNLQFNTADGGLRLRGLGGTDADRANMIVGNRSSGSSTPASSAATLSFNGHPIDAKVGTLTLGENTQNANVSMTITGNLSFNQGTFDVSTIIMALIPSGNTQASSTANANISVGNTGTLVVGNGGISLLNIVGAGAGNAAAGTLIITNGGTVTSSGSIVRSTAAGTSTITISNGTLNMVSGTVGTPGTPINTLNLAGGTLQLNLNGNSPVTNIVATAIVTNGGVTTISIGSVANVSSPTTFPLIGYTGTDPFGNLVLAPLPNGFTGVLVDDAGKIDLNVTPPTAGPSLVWVGATNSVLTSSWDTTTPNWLDAATLTTPQVYADLDPVRFDDTASNNVVTLTTNVAPFSLLVTNNALNYTFNGAGKISGSTSLIKNGPGTLTLAGTGGDSFNGGIIVSNGTLVLDNAGSAISGGLNLVAGTVQLGNNDANGNLPNGTITDNGSLIFNRSDNFTLSTAISGTGSVTKNANNTLTLSVNNGFSGGLTANAGTVRLSTVGAPGSGTITANTGGTVVLGALSSNSIVLSAGTLGSSANLNPLTNDLTVTASTISTIYTADPQNLTPTDGNEMAWSNTLHGAGTIIVATVTNDSSADSGNGFRLRGITASDFSGILIFSNNTKGELQTTVAGPFSPAGTGKIVMVCGTAYLTNATTEPTIGGYSEINFRNNAAGDTTFGNDVQLLGSGLALLNPLGTATGGTKITMGNLTIGGGQELGVYLSANPSHPIVFPTATFTGGTVTLSPKTPGFGATTAVGGDLSFGNISESSASSLVMNGLRTLLLTGISTYSGSTTVSNGTLEVDGAIQGAGSVTVNAGATLDGVGAIAGPVSIAANGTLAPGNATTAAATLTISNILTLAGTNSMDVNKTGSVFTGDVITNITTLHYGGTLQLNLTGNALVAGDAFKLYGLNSADGAFAAIIPATPGNNLAWDTSTLATGVLSVVSTVNTSPTNITTSVTGNVLTLSWPADHTGWRLQTQTNSLITGLDTNWVDMPGTASVNSTNIIMDPANGSVFYRMIYQ